MGVPAFYRWITEKYGKIVVDVLEQRPVLVNGNVKMVNLNEPNPNQFEFDNLYIDMNGLIHPCSHPEDREAPKTEEEMYINVTHYLDRLVTAIRPRNLLFLAIDGVAPRAKMNQQRSRRFRSAQEARERKEMRKKVLQEMEELGIKNDEEGKDDEEAWDSNVITPGTEFMTKISKFIQFYVLNKMNHDSYWKGLTVILSDASEPGEGEHKIMDFIRYQRCQPDYNPNIHHVIHGLDADLIMLALATHEPNFTILREKVFFGKKHSKEESSDDMKSQSQKLFDLQYQSLAGGKIYEDHATDWVYHKPLEALHIFYLREYLSYEFQTLAMTLPFQYDFERIIDDFIFLCFFVGNDFLPHLPSLDIRDGALDFLIQCYKEVLPTLGNYLTNSGGNINLMQVDVILSKVGEIEDILFQRKKVVEDQSERRNEIRRQQNQQHHNNHNQNNQQLQRTTSQQSQSMSRQSSLASTTAATEGAETSQLGKRKTPEESTDAAELTLEEDPVVEEDEEEGEGVLSDIPLPKVSNEQYKLELKNRLKAKEHELIDNYKTSIQDTVKLHEHGWKDRYYQDPLKAKNIEQGGGFQKMCYTYVQGLCWVLKYYYQGVPSWNWYYPFHYAPFASDLVNIDSYGNIEFEKSSPFSPLEQLLSVLPPASAKALPEECRWLMLDPKSPIIDIYDENVPIDANGKHLPWLWILLLPFLDEQRIVDAFNLCRPHLTYDSLQRNSYGQSIIFTHKDSIFGQQSLQEGLLQPAIETDPYILDFFERHPTHPEREVALGVRKIGLTDEKSAVTVGKTVDIHQEDNKLYGKVTYPSRKWYMPLDERVYPPAQGEYWWDPIENNQIITLQYNLPTLLHIHRSVLLPNLIVKPFILTPQDLPHKRPPRLNKSGFNILDLFGHNNNNGGSHYNNRNHQQNYIASSQYGDFNQRGSQVSHYNTAVPGYGGKYQQNNNGGPFQNVHQQLNWNQSPPQSILFQQQQQQQQQNHHQSQQQYQQRSNQHHQQHQHRSGHDNYNQSQQRHRSDNSHYQPQQQQYSGGRSSHPQHQHQQGRGGQNHHQSQSQRGGNDSYYQPSGGNRQGGYEQQGSFQQQQQYNNNNSQYSNNNYQHQQANHAPSHSTEPPSAQRNSTHRIESLQSNLSRAINQNRGSLSNRPSRTIMVAPVPGGNAGSAQYPPQQQPAPSSGFSFNSRSTPGQAPPGGNINSMQAMRDQLLQTMNNKAPPRR
eukprot:gene13745-15153_t